MSFSQVTLTPFLSPLPPTTPDKCVVLPDSGRCELAVRQRFVGRSDPGVAALDQEGPRSIPRPRDGGSRALPRIVTSSVMNPRCAGMIFWSAREPETTRLGQ